jgi:hypothetical protein
MFTKQDVLEQVPHEEGTVTILVLSEATETLGGTLKVIIPFIQAGYSHVVVDQYLECIIADAPVELTNTDINRAKFISSPGSYVTLESGQTVCAYHIDLDEEL